MRSYRKNAMNKRVTIILACLMAVFTEVKAQDPHFSQFYANPVYINPAFAGTAVCPRLSMAYRDQWNGINGAFKTFIASYDQHFDFLSGGLGVWFMNDRESNVFGTNTAALAYSYRIRVKRDFYINASLQVSVINRRLDWNNLTFGDMIDPRYGFIYETRAKQPDNLSHTMVDFSAGILGYTDIWYAGFAAAHFTRPDDGFNSENRLPVKFTVHGGAKLDFFKDKRRTSKFLQQPIFQPNLIYQYQGGFHNLNYGLYVDWNPFIVGAWFRQALSFGQPDAFIFTAGLQYNRFKVGYSYDMTVSKLVNVSGGTHEVSLELMFDCPAKRVKVKEVKCPAF